MPDIIHEFLIDAPASRVFEGFSKPAVLDQWWTRRSSGKASEGSEWELWFGPKFDWRGKVSRSVPDRSFEWEITRADPDWLKTRVGADLEARGKSTIVQFHHNGWPEANEHYRVSCYCWAMYLRILKRYLERGETVSYEDRLNV